LWAGFVLVFLKHFGDVKHFCQIFSQKIAEVVKSTQEKQNFPNLSSLKK
jgi:hypothetical protein